MDIIEFRPFEIGQKEYINRFFGEHHYERADCSFDTLFLWQHAYHTMWAVEDGVLFIRAGYGDQTFFMPPFAGTGRLSRTASRSSGTIWRRWASLS